MVSKVPYLACSESWCNILETPEKPSDTNYVTIPQVMQEFLLRLLEEMVSGTHSESLH